jgi:hypothetical protein
VKLHRAISGILLACTLALLPSCGRADVAAPPPARSPSARTTPPTPTVAVTLPLITSPADATGVVTGTVQISNGSCCAGGAAGSTISLPVAFSATSGAGPVSEMRVGVGLRCGDERIGIQPWEPFQTSKSYTTTLAVNWVGWYIAAQYRDAQGNLSPVVCDDISLEGMPPTPAAQ